jgi:hypothetical protein
MVAPFGTALHVSGTDRDAIERAVATVSSQVGLKAHEVEPTLEDVFIHLMRGLGESARPDAKGA